MLCVVLCRTMPFSCIDEIWGLRPGWGLKRWSFDEESLPSLSVKPIPHPHVILRLQWRHYCSDMYFMTSNTCAIISDYYPLTICEPMTHTWSFLVTTRYGFRNSSHVRIRRFSDTSHPLFRRPEEMTRHTCFPSRSNVGPLFICAFKTLQLFGMNISVLVEFWQRRSHVGWIERRYVVYIHSCP